MTPSQGRLPSDSPPTLHSSSTIRPSVGPIVSGRPCVITAARRTGSANCFVDPGVEVIGKLGIVSLAQVEEELAVALRARQARVYDAHRLSLPAQRGLGDVP